MLELRRWRESFPLFALLLIACSSGDEDNGPRTISFEFCPGDVPTWVAQQDGSTGTWQRVTPTSATRWDFVFTGDRGGIARVTRTALSIHLASTGELAVFADWLASQGCGASDVEVAIAGVPEEDTAIVNLGDRTAWAAEGPLLLRDVVHGTWPLVAVRTSGWESIAERIILRRGVSVTGPGVLNPPIDFESTEWFAAATAILTVTSLEPRERAGVKMDFLANGHGEAMLGTLSVTPDSNTAAYGGIPLDLLDTGDFQSLHIETADFYGNDLKWEITNVDFRAVADRSVAAGPPLATPTIDHVASYPNLRPRVLLEMQAQYNRSVYGAFRQSGRLVAIEATSAYLGNPSSWVVVVPDFTGVDGWDKSWGLDPTEPYLWQVRGHGGTRDRYDEPFDGAIRRMASVSPSRFMAQDVAPQPFGR